MRRIIALLIAVTILLSLCACGNQEETVKLAFNDDPEAITAASASVVMISVYDKAGELIATGSGFPAFEEGIIVTNAHVIEGGDHFEANTETEMYFKIDSVVAVDSERDIAILKTNAKTGFDVLPVGSSSSLMKGEKVVAIGSPLGLINTVSEGMYSNVRAEEGRNYLQFTAEISEGSSGGALFNNAGEVIGVTSASYIKGENLNLAVPIEDVVDVWEHKDDFPVEVQSQASNVLSVAEYKENEGNTVHEGDEILVSGYVSSRYIDESSDVGFGCTYWLYIVDDISEVLGRDILITAGMPSYRVREYENLIDAEKTRNSAVFKFKYKHYISDIAIGDHVTIKILIVTRSIYGHEYLSSECYITDIISSNEFNS